MTKTHEFPTLYGRASTGAIHEWTIWTEGAYIVTDFGMKDGKHQTARKKVEAKSIGRSNETTVEEQAIKEALSMWKKKQDKGYKQTLNTARTDEVFLPMLAKKYEERPDKVVYPCSVQPKLDGLRCMAYWVDDKTVTLMSRGNKTYDLSHITDELAKILPKNLILDGELYAHGESMQTIASWVKRTQDDTVQIKYHVYDCILDDNREAIYSERFEALVNWYNNSSPETVAFVDTFAAMNENEIFALHNEFVDNGYEGAIVRNNHGVYKLKHRSSDLLKVKSFVDDEFQVLSWKVGDGRFENCPIWICKVTDDITVDCVMKGTMAQRKEMLENADSYIGQWLKIKYFGFTDAGSLRFPTGLCFRLPEDM